MDSLLCGWASEGVGEAVGRPVDPCWDDKGNDVDAGPQRVEPDEAPTVVVEESDVAALAEEMRKLSEDAIAMKEQMRLLELERLEAHLEAERAARAEDAADEDEPAAPATVAGALAPPAPEDDEAADAPPAAYAPAEYSPAAAEPRPAATPAPAGGGLHAGGGEDRARGVHAGRRDAVPAAGDDVAAAAAVVVAGARALRRHGRDAELAAAAERWPVPKPSPARRRRRAEAAGPEACALRVVELAFRRYAAEGRLGRNSPPAGRLRALAAAELVDFGDAARYLALAPADDPLAAVVDATRRNTLAAECELLATPEAMEARDGAPGLGRLQFVELLGHVGLRAMPGDTPKRRLLELVAWLDKSKGRAALGHPHRATLAFAFH
ncbi:hypothetical protein JL720_10597 [Aureococcus anophagefferens]|nr:hypothetical protein JL720_10597 [Aureococcus anophagefferens]